MMHTGRRPHTCPHCPFSSRLSLHLRRHMRVHTGAKPYKCPHCPYRCNVMENLRKHVLTTKSHADKKLYVCHECDDFSTNSAKEIQTHLMTTHASKFTTGAEASARIMADIYEGEAEARQPNCDAPEPRLIEVPVSTLKPNISEVQELNLSEDPEPTLSEGLELPYEDVTHTIDHEETVNIVTVEQAVERGMVMSCPSGQLLSMIVLPPNC